MWIGLGLRHFARKALKGVGMATTLCVLLLSVPVTASSATSAAPSGGDPASDSSPSRSEANPKSTADETNPFFGVYPGGGTGETPEVPNPDPRLVDQRLKELASGRPMAVHLYTAWSWHSDADLDAQVTRYTGAGLKVTLTVKYSPPQGHEGDVAGYENFVRAIVRRYAGNPGVVSYVIGNEANVTGNPDAQDGPFVGARAAVVRGSIAAKDEMAKLKSTARVGINFAVGSAKDNSDYLRDLVAQGGAKFATSVDFIGINVYPGIWQAGTDDPYRDMVSALDLCRASINAVPSLANRPLEVREVGAPLVDEAEKTRRVRAFTQAAIDNRARLSIEHFSWFDLWDANSSSTYQFAHYGLLRSDLSRTTAFDAYRELIERANDAKAKVPHA